jgi:hypothetical protein
MVGSSIPAAAPQNMAIHALKPVPIFFERGVVGIRIVKQEPH